MRLNRHRTSLRPVAIALSASTLAAGLAACGAASTTTSGAANCATTAPGITSSAVNVGFIYPDTGSGAQTMDAFRAGVDARLGAANAAGGVNGRKVSYTWRDDQGQPAVNDEVAKELIPTTFGIIEAPGATAGSIDDLAKQNVPVTGLGSDAGWQGKNNMFSWVYLGNGSTTAWGEYLAQAGAHRVAVLATTGSSANNDFSRQFESSLLSQHLQVKLFPVSDATTNYRVVAQQMKTDGIDAIAGVLLPSAAAQLIPYARSVGVPLKVALMPLGYDSNDLRQFGQSLGGVSVFTAVKPMENPSPQQQAFLSAMQHYAPQTSSPKQDMAIDGWVSTDLFLRGLQVAGACPTRASFISGLRGVTNYDAAGMSPGVTDLSKNFNQISECYDVVQYNSAGTGFTTVMNAQGGEDHCGSEISPAQMNSLLSSGIG